MIISLPAEVVERQTRMLQAHVPVRVWGFKSLPPHGGKSEIFDFVDAPPSGWWDWSQGIDEANCPSATTIYTDKQDELVSIYFSIIFDCTSSLSSHKITICMVVQPYAYPIRLMKLGAKHKRSEPSISYDELLSRYHSLYWRDFFVFVWKYLTRNLVRHFLYSNRFQRIC